MIPSALLIRRSTPRELYVMRVTPGVFGGPKKQNPANAGFCDVSKF
jgi:hypothetical protein